MRALKLAGKGGLCMILWGFDETYQYMQQSIVSNPAIQKFIDNFEALRARSDELDAAEVEAANKKGVAHKRNPRRKLLRQAMVQTGQLREYGTATERRERFIVPPCLVSTTSALVLGAAIIIGMEQAFTSGMPLAEWLTTMSPYDVTFLYFVADSASGNTLFRKIMRGLQHFLEPLIFLLIWMEPCGIHQGVRVLIVHLERLMTTTIFKYCSGTSHFELRISNFEIRISKAWRAWDCIDDKSSHR
jgi:hypothetical protein